MTKDGGMEKNTDRERRERDKERLTETQRKEGRKEEFGGGAIWW